MRSLRQRYIEELTRRNRSPRTITTYVAAVARTANYFNLSPDRLTTEQLRLFQLHLIAQSALWSVFNQITCALRFFYRHVLQRPDFVPFVVYVPPGRNRLMVRIAYGCGLRVSELMHLRVIHVDSARNTLWVRHGKGNKDRGVPLPAELLQELHA